MSQTLLKDVTCCYVAGMNQTLMKDIAMLPDDSDIAEGCCYVGSCCVQSYSRERACFLSLQVSLVTSGKSSVTSDKSVLSLQVSLITSAKSSVISGKWTFH